MKKGFALLETIIVITFLCVSLLLLYSSFSSMINNSKKNILYDDASDIYKTLYLKEYLLLNSLDKELINANIQSISCANFSFSSCPALLNHLDVHNIYIAKYDLKDYSNEDYSSTLASYLSTLSNKESYLYRFIVEYNHDSTYSYASLGFGGDNHE